MLLLLWIMMNISLSVGDILQMQDQYIARCGREMDWNSPNFELSTYHFPNADELPLLDFRFQNTISLKRNRWVGAENFTEGFTEKTAFPRVFFACDADRNTIMVDIPNINFDISKPWYDTMRKGNAWAELNKPLEAKGWLAQPFGSNGYKGLTHDEGRVNYYIISPEQRVLMLDGFCTEIQRWSSGNFFTYIVQYSHESSNIVLPDCSIYEPDDFCPDCYPLMNYLGAGFDITQDSSHINDKDYVARLFGSMIPIQGQYNYLIPENALFTSIDTTIQTLSSFTFESNRELQKSIGASFGLDASIPGKPLADITASIAISASESSSFANNLARSEKILAKGLNSIELKNDISHTYMAFQLKEALEAVSKYCYLNYNNKTCYDMFVKKIIQKFGTHYISKITVGGDVKFIIETSSCLTSEERKTILDAALCANIKLVGGTCAGASATDVEVASKVSAIENYILEITGGDTSVSLEACKLNQAGIFDCDFKVYSDALTSENAGLIKFELREIAQLIQTIQQRPGHLTTQDYFMASNYPDQHPPNTYGELPEGWIHGNERSATSLSYFRGLDGPWYGFSAFLEDYDRSSLDLSLFFKKYIKSQAYDVEGGCLQTIKDNSVSSGGHKDNSLRTITFIISLSFFAI